MGNETINWFVTFIARTEKYRITEYTPKDSVQLLELFLQLHKTYFSKSATRQIQEVRKEKNIKKSYQDYIRFLDKNYKRDWKIFLAITPSKKAVGLIIGSITRDSELVYGTIGKFEDWFVHEKWRGFGIGGKLYHSLEDWFKKKGCQQVISDTWDGNMLSIEAHLKLGFFISGINFSKKLADSH